MKCDPLFYPLINEAVRRAGIERYDSKRQAFTKAKLALAELAKERHGEHWHRHRRAWECAMHELRDRYDWWRGYRVPKHLSHRERR